MGIVSAVKTYLAYRRVEKEGKQVMATNIAPTKTPIKTGTIEGVNAGVAGMMAIEASNFILQAWPNCPLSQAALVGGITLALTYASKYARKWLENKKLAAIPPDPLAGKETE